MDEEERVAREEQEEKDRLEPRNPEPNTRGFYLKVKARIWS